ncbi:predicted protein [Thalassiosira pseudonana CCMP1335]|uniref:Mitochondrial carrier protein n=1 Tax=Thalassiosira pseudonana TaxID=35128 RepID=B8CAB8_THAPS|nr:predicted protein [Thalassiosira pseudonana CCMP1335]EED89477.1 predicted protein [Thalassiosira pseudonana CCMP1335]|eukprot:g11297.t1 g11297   contig5:548945-549973(-)
MEATSEVESNDVLNLTRRLTLSTASSPSTVDHQPHHADGSTSYSSSSSTLPKTQALHDLIAGGVAGSAGIIVGHPFDSIKVRMQMMASSSSGSTSSAMSLLQNSQYGSIWRGIGAPLTMAAVINASIFLTYGGSTRMWNAYFDTNSEKKSLWRDGGCGGFTGVVSSLIICPTEHVKTKMQTQKKVADANNRVVYQDSFHAARNIVSNYGITGLYRGLAATTARQSPGFVVYFGTYDRLKEYGIKHYFGTQHSLLASMTAGGMAGSLSWAIVYPVDLIKSRIQALPIDCAKSERSMVNVARGVIESRGVGALYRGFGITMLRAFPVNGVIFPTYELVLSTLKE